jgi:hypothetical protein
LAKLVIVTHEYDRFTVRKPGEEVRSPYLLHGILKQLETMGHDWTVAAGPIPMRGDVAILHVDSTIVDQRYVDLASRYRRAINFGTGDISKRATSRILVAEGDDWQGPVIVKADFNNRAIMEYWHNYAARQLRRPLPHPGIGLTPPYQLLDHCGLVPEEVWANPALVVERFLPEPDDSGGYALRAWVFMGERERCNRIVTPGPISKGADIVTVTPVDIPAEIRAERERLKFDYGKFDFVVHDGVPVLLDANRTPGIATAIQSLHDAGAMNLAEGLDAMLRESE